jgi:hypothetical protein
MLQTSCIYISFFAMFGTRAAPGIFLTERVRALTLVVSTAASLQALLLRRLALG